MHGRGSHHGNQTIQRIGTRQIASDIIPYRRRVGGTAVVADKPKPLEITLQRPVYANEIDTELLDLQSLVWVHLGYIGGIKPENVYSEHVIMRSAPDSSVLVTNYIYAEVSLGQQPILAVNGVMIVVDQAQRDLTTPWTNSLQRPSLIRILLGVVVSRAGGLEVVADSGDFNVFEITNTETSNGGFVTQVLSQRV